MTVELPALPHFLAFVNVVFCFGEEGFFVTTS